MNKTNSENKPAFFGAVIDPHGSLPGNITIGRASGGAIKSSITSEIFFAPELSPPWAAPGENFFLPLAGPLKTSSETGKPIAWAKANGKELPLITETAPDRFTFHFDPAATFEHILLEKYRNSKTPLIAKLPFDYHAIPANIRSPISRAVTAAFLGSSKAAGKNAFPSFPVEKSLEALLHAMRQCCAAAHQTPPRFSVFLSHDVDAPGSIPGISKLSRVEAEFGVHSAWFITGKLFRIFEKVISALYESGHEIGLHEVEHDLKFPFLSAKEMTARLDSVASFIQKYKICGFRSPYYLRSEKMFETLAGYFQYDSSLPDSDTFTPGRGRGGCALARPFKIGKLLELPVTLPFEIPFLAGVAPAKLIDYWRAKIEFVRAAGGTLVVNTHPDPAVSAREDMLKTYMLLLEYLSSIGGKFLLPGKDGLTE